MKIAVSGKGGVGKTTIAGTLARILAHEGFKVLAIDADSNANLALSLGIPLDQAQQIVPVSENVALIEEKTGVQPESYGGVFRLSFRVDDIIERYGVRTIEGVNLLVMGVVRSAGQGCMCPANALVRALIRYLIMRREEVVILDMEAGTEHFGRRTAENVNVMLVVADANLKSLETAKTISGLSKEMGIEQVFIVGNKVLNAFEEDVIRAYCSKNTIPLLGLIPYDIEIRKSDVEGHVLNLTTPSLGVQALRKMRRTLLKA